MTDETIARIPKLALADFKRVLNDISRVKILADEFAQSLEKRLDDAEELFYIAQQRRLEAEADETLETHIGE